MVTMKASEHALTLLKHFEGLSTKAYICPAGVLTVGYGHTGRDVKPGMVITAAQAENLLRRDVEHFENGLTKFLNLDGIYVTQGQFDALLCFSYNLGLRALISSTLWSKLQKK